MKPSSIEPQQHFQKLQAFLVVTSAIAAAIVAGSAVYAFQIGQSNKVRADLQSQITDLNSRLSVSQSTTSATPTPPSSYTPAPKVTASAPASAGLNAEWKTYTDSTHGISFKYPSRYGTVTLQDDAIADKLSGHSWDYKLSNADQPWFGFVSNDFQGTSVSNDYAVTGFIANEGKCGWSTNKGILPIATTDCLTVPGPLANDRLAYIANAVEHGTSKLYGFVPLSNINDGSKPAFTFVYQQPTATSSDELKAILASFTLFN